MLAQQLLRGLAAGVIGSSRRSEDGFIKSWSLPDHPSRCKRDRWHFSQLKYGKLREDAVGEKDLIPIDGILEAIHNLGCSL